MPRVPTYDNFTVAPTVNPDVRVVAPEIQDFGSKQAAAAGQAMLVAGSAVSRIGADMQNDANLVRVDDATNKANEAALALQYDKANGFLNIKGEAALNRESGMPLADEYRDKFKQRVDEISQSLGNDAQRKMFGLKANDMATRLYGTATAHETQQFNDYTVSVQDGKIKNASNAIVLDPLNKDNVVGRLEEINQAVYVVGKTKGMSAEAIAATQREAVSGTHMNVVKSLLENENTDGASAYFKEFKGQMSGIQQADAQKMLNQADNSKVAITTADDLWSRMGPKGYNDPVDIFKMESEVRGMFPDSPTKAKATIEELRSRKAAFDASQGEFVASNTNTIGKLMASGKTLAQIQASPAYNALPGDKQAQITEHVGDRQHMLWARSIEDKNRMEAEAARKAGPAYLRYSDPNVLVGMSRTQVEALWPQLGAQHTTALVQRWDTLQNKDALLTAKMDNDQFNAIADQFDLKPFANNKSEDQKRELGVLKARVDTVLEQAAKEKRQPLTKDEKDNIMRTEMARTVTVNPGWYWPSSTKPMIQLTPGELKNVELSSVVVPERDRQQIKDALASAYAQQKQPQYEPTETNIRMLYVRKNTPAAKVQNGK